MKHDMTDEQMVADARKWSAEVARSADGLRAMAGPAADAEIERAIGGNSQLADFLENIAARLAELSALADPDSLTIAHLAAHHSRDEEVRRLTAEVARLQAEVVEARAAIAYALTLGDEDRRYFLDRWRDGEGDAISNEYSWDGAGPGWPEFLAEFRAAGGGGMSEDVTRRMVEAFAQVFDRAGLSSYSTVIRQLTNTPGVLHLTGKAFRAAEAAEARSEPKP